MQFFNLPSIQKLTKINRYTRRQDQINKNQEIKIDDSFRPKWKEDIRLLYTNSNTFKKVDGEIEIFFKKNQMDILELENTITEMKNSIDDLTAD